MKQEDKDLLLQDLCARLPYGVKCKVWYNDKTLDIKCTGIDFYTNTVNLDISEDDNAKVYVDNIKPYLFPLSSITEEQNKILIKNYHFSFNSCSDGITNGIYSPTFNRTIYYSVDEDDISKIIDWLNKNHIDYRNLIEKGLAIDCTNLNIY